MILTDSDLNRIATHVAGGGVALFSLMSGEQASVTTIKHLPGSPNLLMTGDGPDVHVIDPSFIGSYSLVAAPVAGPEAEEWMAAFEALRTACMATKDGSIAEAFNVLVTLEQKRQPR